MRNCPLLAAAILALFLSACGGGGGGGDDEVEEGGNPLEQPPVGNPLEAPAIDRTLPVHAELQVPRNTPIQIYFLVPIDAASVQLDSMVLEGSGGPIPGTTVMVTELIVAFVPDDDLLPYGDTYIVTLRPGIRAQSGEERATAYAYAFRAYESEFLPDTLHESLSTNCRLSGLKMNAAGDGLSLFSDNGSAGWNLRFRRIRGGVPVGAIGIVGPGLGASALDVAENGNAQVAWRSGSNDPATAEAFVRQFNRGSDSWGETFPLTPDPGVAAVSVDAEMTDDGGLVAWVERDFDDGENHRLLAGQYTDGSGLSNVSQLGSSTGSKSGLKLSRRGPHGVLAFRGTDPDIGRVQASRFLGSPGFQTVEFLDPANSGVVKAVASSGTGHLFVLFIRIDPAGTGFTWMLSVANPGQAFGAPTPLHQGASATGQGRLAVGNNGILTVLYSLGRSDIGIWVRRYTPGTGLSAASEMTGVSRTVDSGDFNSLGLEADATGNAVAVAVVGTISGGQMVRAAVLPVDGPPTLGMVLSDEPHDSPYTREIRLAMEPSGGAIIQWLSVSANDSSQYALRTQRIRGDGTYGDSHIYNGTPNTSPSLISSTHVAMTANGNGLILYDLLGEGAGAPGPDNIHQALID